MVDSVIELKPRFVGRGEVRGFEFKLLDSNSKGYLFRVLAVPATLEHYEVFLRIINQFGQVSYPRSKSFGKTAWSFYNLEKAKDKLKSFDLIKTGSASKK